MVVYEKWIFGMILQIEVISLQNDIVEKGEIQTAFLVLHNTVY